MPYTYSLPPLPSFDGEGFFGYTFGPLRQKDLEIYYIEVEKGHDTFMVSKRITRVYYVISGSGFFTIGDRRYDIRVPFGVPIVAVKPARFGNAHEFHFP